MLPITLQTGPIMPGWTELLQLLQLKQNMPAYLNILVSYVLAFIVFSIRGHLLHGLVHAPLHVWRWVFFACWLLLIIPLLSMRALDANDKQATLLIVEAVKYAALVLFVYHRALPPDVREILRIRQQLHEMVVELNERERRRAGVAAAQAHAGSE